MAYAVKNKEGKWIELQVGQPLIVDDIATSYESVLNWSSQYRTSQGVKVIQEIDIPSGKYVLNKTVEDQDNKPVYVYQYATLADPTPAPKIISKVDLTRRVTEDEAEMLNAALEQSEAKLKLLYLSINNIHYDAPEFPVLENIFVSLFGRSRTDELLAPSTEGV